MTLDELDDYGMVRMTDEEVAGYLASQRVGVLGLPAERAPSLRPMSFGFDGDSRLYLLYVLGEESRKAELSAAAEYARFLVYSAETPFNWRSVLLTGRLTEVPEADVERAEEVLTDAWRPDVFERASRVEATRLYCFDIEERTGLKHLGLPPGFEDQRTG
ncbi:pyridoxamine 5'-phosphate oxidase family protein [Salinigranum rubrum]|uniref:Pyridoxamine 5'-phosphate oxidase family protein n=1 Tax=Salinigranum rubrum TaxID=755307 RepID=A0A2I8VNK8_9EURY|nr:pyridoxamine 5'-phosphate oxidase family protein [Salinigranum rubrum]AUV83498.1 pyridoxamine 5'-phosphate oxidase family protein [Salinigranum rubrum]